jgi:hypothetical protein
MKRALHLMLIMALLAPVEFSLISSASAAKTGSVCKKLNSKSWDGDQPLVCKRVSGKLKWVRFTVKASPSTPTPTPTPTKYSLSIFLSGGWKIVRNEELPARDIANCSVGKFGIINSGSNIKVTDSSNKIVGVGTVRWIVSDVKYYPGSFAYYEGTCLLSGKVENLTESNFYQLTVGNVNAGTYQFADLVSKNWELRLFLN